MYFDFDFSSIVLGKLQFRTFGFVLLMYKEIYYSNLNDVFDLVSKKNNKIGIGIQKEALPFEEIATSLSSRLN